jgi:hypothetical protein
MTEFRLKLSEKINFEFLRISATSSPNYYECTPNLIFLRIIARFFMYRSFTLNYLPREHRIIEDLN